MGAIENVRFPARVGGENLDIFHMNGDRRITARPEEFADGRRAAGRAGNDLHHASVHPDVEAPRAVECEQIIGPAVLRILRYGADAAGDENMTFRSRSE